MQSAVILGLGPEARLFGANLAFSEDFQKSPESVAQSGREKRHRAGTTCLRRDPETILNSALPTRPTRSRSQWGNRHARNTALSEITEILCRLSAGESNAIEELTPLVYQQLRQIAQNQLTDSPNDARQWDATELVHEAYLRMVGDVPVTWRDRAHFFAAAATSIRRVLVDKARARKRQKRGGDAQQIPWDLVGFGREEIGCELLELDDALSRLAELSTRQAQIVEMRFFGGLSEREIAELLQVSRRTVSGDWAMAKAWLFRELQD